SSADWQTVDEFPISYQRTFSRSVIVPTLLWLRDAYTIGTSVMTGLLFLGLALGRDGPSSPRFFCRHLLTATFPGNVSTSSASGVRGDCGALLPRRAN